MKEESNVVPPESVCSRVFYVFKLLLQEYSINFCSIARASSRVNFYTYNCISQSFAQATIVIAFFFDSVLPIYV